jgi:hypothetical protein
MKLTLRTPSRRRAKGFGKALQAVGNVVGALSLTVRPGKKDRPKLLRFLIPASVLGALAAGIAQRRRARASLETWTAPSSPPQPPTTDVTATETERRKVEAEGGMPSTEAVAETARGAGGETTASAEAASGESSS